jgi:phage terminase large subunit
MLDTKKGKKPLRVGISTRKSKHGIMNRMIENADKEGRHIRFWTALEFTEKCPDTRSGVDHAEYWVNQDAGETLTPEEFLKKDNSKKKDFTLYTDMYTGCHKCPVAPFCLGDAKKQSSKSNMLKSIDELNQKIRSEGYDWAASQLFNLKPSTEGIVFKEFEERIHVKTWNQMWFTLTGKDFPGECTHDMFIKKCHEMKLACYGGVDWGWSAPNTVVYFFVDKKENIYVVRCDGLQFVSQPSWIHHMKTKYQHMYKCQLYVPDAADQGAVQEMIKAGLPVANKPDKGAINTGIQVIKKFLRFPGTNEAKIFFAKETTQHILTEMSMYHYKLDAAGIVTDDPDTEYDHWIDALRYPITMLFGKQNVILGGGGLDFDPKAGIVDPSGTFHKMPSPQEYAATKGITLNDQEQNLSKLGRVGTLSDLDDDSDDDGNDGGGGSFSWSF